MTYEHKRDFIAHHVSVQEVGKRNKKTYKNMERTYRLPMPDGSSVRVCKTCFLKMLDISDKMVRYTIEKKSLGASSGKDKRGSHYPWNKFTQSQTKSEKNISNRFQSLAHTINEWGPSDSF